MENGKKNENLLFYTNIMIFTIYLIMPYYIFFSIKGNDFKTEHIIDAKNKNDCLNKIITHYNKFDSFKSNSFCI